ncbi:MAG TPA: MFS transporter [Anaerolineae bacterium]
MLAVIYRARAEYPSQFWLVFWGMLISAVGGSMIWPFLMVYVSERLSLPMTTTASLMTLSAATGLVASFIAGPIVDRFGRKWIMVISLVLNALGYVLMSQAQTLPQFAILMALNGIVNPLYRIGLDSMIADLIPAHKRADAYSLTRMANNIGVAVGPAAGGFIAAISYSIAFYIAAGGLVIFGLLIALFAIETLPPRDPAAHAHAKERFGGYGSVLRDVPFMGFVTSFTLVMVAASLVWVLLAVYVKQNYGIPESQYGFIPTTNALMVILFQFAVTQVTKRRPPLRMVAVGAVFYAVATAGIALGQGFWAFWLCMVILTCGELIIMPTSSTYVANLAPADKRGRYMSLFGLSWSVASGIGPIFGGMLNDSLGPHSIWYGGGLAGLIGVAGFLIMNWRFPHTHPVELTAESAVK